MKSFFYLILIMMTISGLAETYSQKKISLNDAINLAVNQNSSVVKNSNSIITYQANIKNAYGNLLPNLNIGGGFNWQRISDDGGKTQIDYFGNPQTIGPSQIDSRNWSVSARGNVTLFDGLSNIASINKSKSDLEAAKLNLEKLKQDVILQTVNLYVQIVSYQKLLNFQQEDLDYNNGLLDRVKEMYNLKMVSISDVYSQEAQSANSRVAFLQAKNNLEKAKINLISYLSLDISQNYQFDSTITTANDSLLTNVKSEDLIEYALSNRKDLQSMRYQQESAQNQLTIARGGLFPILTGNYGFSSSAVQPSDLMNRRIYSFGLSLNIPVFSNWNTETSIQSAEVQVKNNEEDLKTLESNIKSQVATAALDLQTARQQLDASNTALTATKESWQIKKESYRLGAATYLDLQLAYNNYLQAQYNKINNEYKYLFAQYTLLNVIGRY
ncbi:MAG TPA: TolC family protein [Ignavibacteriaceae bacterium]